MSILKLKDSQGNWIGVPTIKGDNGNGISSAVLNNDYTLTLTFTDGTTYTTPSIRGEKGEKGEPATDMDIHICSASEYDSETRIPTIANPDDKTFYLVPTEDGTSPDLFTEWVYVNNAWEMFGSASVDLSGYLTDVQVNRTSVVTDGVAEIPIANTARLGVVKIKNDFGVMANGSGELAINGATTSEIKNGTANFKAITPIHQHESTFYGLAQASGTDERTSELPFGQYTDEAKSSIQNMLDVPSTSELKEVNDSKADVIVESASGDIVSFNDGADDMPLKSLVVDINPVQNLNGYDHPWVGGGGKNKLIFPYDFTNGTEFGGLTANSDNKGIVTISGTKTANSTLTFKAITLAAGTYTASVGTELPSGASFRVYHPTTNTTFVATSTSATFTLTEELEVYVYIVFQSVLTGDVNITIKPQIEEGSTATDWTPYENICPISGWAGMQVMRTGVNIWDEEWELGGLQNGIPDSTVNKIRSKNYTLVKPSTKYYCAYGGGGTIGVWFYDDEHNVLGVVSPSNREFETPTNASYIRFACSTGYGTTYNHDISINYPSTDHDYHPYVGQTIPINWQTETGTVYGGKLDVLSGVLTVDKAIFDLETTVTNVQTFITMSMWYSNSLASLGIKEIPSGYSSDFVGYCDSYPILSYGNSQTTLYSLSVRCDGNRKAIYVKTDGTSDIKPTGNAVFELAEPTEIQLTPQEVKSLLGQNNIWADTGNTSVEYCADTEMYIEKVKPIVNVDDVQINGQSIVTDGVANVPIASSSAYGAVKYSNGGYNGIIDHGGILSVNPAFDTEIKSGGQGYKPVTPMRQHLSVFYGLAKSAGDTTQSASSNAVGVYTEDAKSKIQNMLGITDKYSQKEWIAESETELVANAHSVGDLFYIGEALYKVIADLNAGDAVNVGVNVEEVNVNDILDDYATKEDVENNVSIVEKSASGAVASFDDGMDDMPLKSLTVDINPVQDLHGYDSPWVGGGGKNKCFLNAETITKPSWYGGGWLGVSLNSYNGITQTRGYLEGSAGGFVVSGLSAGDWTISFDYDSSQEFVYCGVYYTMDGTVNNELKSPSSQMRFSGSRAYMTVSIPQNQGVIFRPTYRSMTDAYDLNNIQVESGSTATAYSPYENICPISGWTGCNINATGKNLFDEANATVYKRYFRSITGRYVWSPSPDSSSYVFKCMPNTTYTLKPNNSDITIFRVATINVSIEESENVILNQVSTANNPRTITTDSDATYIVIQQSNTIASAKETQLQIELGDSATEYEPFKGVSIPISWQTEAGTVYGGKLDVLSGEGKVTYGVVDLGSLRWEQTDTERHIFRTSELTNHKLVSGINVLCSGYTPVSASLFAANMADKTCKTNSSNSMMLYVRDTSYASTVDFKAGVAGILVVYEFAAPTDFTATPQTVSTLYGQNNIWADTGDTEVEYFSQVDEDLIDYIKVNLKPYAKEEKLNDYVSDVQVNGTSIVNDGVANVPVADAFNKYGVVKVSNYRGLQFEHGELCTLPANTTHIKSGVTGYAPIIPLNQHVSVFYGLAKAAGADEKDSTLAVGNYTDEAKDKIQTMLGVSPLIAPHESDPFESAHEIGELFIINGKLYRAKTALTAGEYINEGTNVEVVDVAEVLDDTYVKNTDYATSNKAGIVKTDVWYATGLVVSNGILYIAPASDAYIKEGNNLRTPIVPRNQHQSVFYGLAKASGDTTQSASDNAVGTYTDEAKTAIKQMLGVHDTYDSFIEEVTGTDVTITGQPSYRYNCGELYSLTVTPPSSGTIDIRFTSGSTPTVLTLPQTVKMPEWWVEVEANTIYEMCITDGIYCGVMSWAV